MGVWGIWRRWRRSGDRRRALKRASRGSEGRCPYCGRFPEPGFAGCARCRELQRVRNAARSERRRAARVAEERAKGPRRCEGCGSENLAEAWEAERATVLLVAEVAGDGRSGMGFPRRLRLNIRARTAKGSVVSRSANQGKARNRTVYYCPACRRYNTNLWPADAPSPGGPFPHYLKFWSELCGEFGVDGVLSGEGDVGGAGDSRRFHARGDEAAGLCQRGRSPRFVGAVSL